MVAFLGKELAVNPKRKVYLWNKRGGALQPIEDLWNLALRPLLHEYLAGLDAKTREGELDRLTKAFLYHAVKE